MPGLTPPSRPHYAGCLALNTIPPPTRGLRGWRPNWGSSRWRGGHSGVAVQGFTGGITIVREYLSRVRPQSTSKSAFIRFASDPGVQCQIDWGHFGTMSYGTTTRHLYCLAVVECRSRLLSLAFTHSQRQKTLHRGLLGTLQCFQGTPKELVHDNMLTAVMEHHGPVVRFNEQFLEFLRPFHITLIACNVRQPQEKGKVEKGAIHSIRHNFWPCAP